MKLWCIVAALAAPAVAHAECADIRLEVPPEMWRTIEPFQPSPSALQGRFRVRGGDGCRAELRVRPAQGQVWKLSGLGPGLSLQPRLGSQQGSGAQALASDLILTGAEEPVDLTLVVPGPQYAEPGLYELEMEAEVVEPGADAPLAGPYTLRAVVEVRPQAQVNIAGAPTSFGAVAVARVVFDDARAGAQERIFVQVRANAQTRITARSENGGRLLNDENPTLALAYSADIDGRRGDLAVPIEISRRPAPGLQGSSYPLVLTLGDSAPFAGSYSDTITVDVTPE